jgi:DNA (cytosine-5)-methyltransferase 1
MNELALFAGAGGGILGGKLLGWKTVCAVEYDEHARDVLKARQDDGCLNPFPIWDDVRTFDGKPWRGLVDIVSGGFPCQDISVAGNGEGITGERSGLWGEMARIIGEVGPRYALVENSPALTLRGLGTVLGDLAEMGYDAVWGVVAAANTGAPHQRDRIWVLAYTPQKRDSGKGKHGRDRKHQKPSRESGGSSLGAVWETDLWLSESGVLRVVDGMAHRVERIGRVGNGQVPQVVALAWSLLSSHTPDVVEMENASSLATAGAGHPKP